MVGQTNIEPVRQAAFVLVIILYLPLFCVTVKLDHAMAFKGSVVVLEHRNQISIPEEYQVTADAMSESSPCLITSSIYDHNETFLEPHLFSCQPTHLWDEGRGLTSA